MLQIQPNDLDFECLGVTRIDMIVLFRVIRLSKNHDLNQYVSFCFILVFQDTFNHA